MVRRRVDHAAQAMSGRLSSGEPSALWSGAVLDSRQVRGGELFFALAGEATDGHRFVDMALDRGAAAAVVHQDLDGESLGVDRQGSQPSQASPSSQTGTARGALIQVDDTYDALHSLTRWVRDQLPKTLIGITGSAGKTTVKELLALMLAGRFATAKSPGNLNNLFGFPLALLGIADDAEVMVAEMGMSTPDELRQVSELGRPDLAVLINVRPVHLENFGTVDAIADAKAEILEGLAAGGTIVANGDDPQVVRVVRRYVDRLADAGEPSPTLVWFALAEQAAVDSVVPDVWAEAIRGRSDGVSGLLPGSRFRLMTTPGRCDVDLPLIGRFNVANFLAAAACAYHLGVPIEEIAGAVTEVEPAEHRGVAVRVPGGPLVIDDSYNSNPDALAQALESAAQLAPPDGQRIAILGDMLELGAEEDHFHRQAGRHAAGLGFDPVVGVGSLAKVLVGAAEQVGVSTLWFADAQAAADWALAQVRTLDLTADDLVLVKGSRSIGLEEVVNALSSSVLAGDGDAAVGGGH